MDDEQSARNLWIGIGAIVPILVAGALVGLRDVMLNVNVALVLVIVVAVTASAGGRMAGVVAALSATLSYDFFHTEPYLRLTIDSADDIETTVLLLAVGLIIGNVAARSRRAQQIASQSRDEIERIHRLAETVAHGAPVEQVLGTATSELRDLLDLRACRFERPPFDGSFPRLERSGAVPNMREHRYHPQGFELPPSGVELPVIGRGDELGRFVLEPTPGVGVSLEQRVVAVALADQVGSALVTHRLN